MAQVDDSRSRVLSYRDREIGASLEDYLTAAAAAAGHGLSGSRRRASSRADGCRGGTALAGVSFRDPG